MSPQIDENPKEIKLARQRLFLLFGMLKTWRGVAAEIDEPVGSVWNFAFGRWTPKNPAKRAKYGLPPVIQTTNAAPCPQCGEMFSPDHATRVYCKICRPPRQYKRRRISARHFDALQEAYRAAVAVLEADADAAPMRATPEWKSFLAAEERLAEFEI